VTKKVVGVFAFFVRHFREPLRFEERAGKTTQHSDAGNFCLDFRFLTEWEMVRKIAAVKF
jgi:hypothetical protein